MTASLLEQLVDLPKAEVDALNAHGSETEFAADSPLEEAGFELPVRGRGKPGYRPFCPAQAPTRSVNVPLITNDGRVQAEGGAVGIEALTPRAFLERKGESG